jgi:hypothetical protein
LIISAYVRRLTLNTEQLLDDGRLGGGEFLGDGFEDGL